MSWRRMGEGLPRAPFHHVEHGIADLSLGRTLSLLYGVAVGIEKKLFTGKKKALLCPPSHTFLLQRLRELRAFF